MEGREFEHSHAFFPLLPSMMRTLAPGGGRCGAALGGRG
jgi:hypothetical protein